MPRVRVEGEAEVTQRVAPMVGEKAVRAMPTCAFAIFKESSADRTSGLRLTIATGKPGES